MASCKGKGSIKVESKLEKSKDVSNTNSNLPEGKMKPDKKLAQTADVERKGAAESGMVPSCKREPIRRDSAWQSVGQLQVLHHGQLAEKHTSLIVLCEVQKESERRVC